jgi:hypothetical protein
VERIRSDFRLRHGEYTLIPRILHYCWFNPARRRENAFRELLKPQWSLVNHVCMMSAIQRIRPTEVTFTCDEEPSGCWWELSRAMVNVERTHAPDDIFGNQLRHVAHKADVARLEKLIVHGGIYLDPDVFVHKGFADLLDNSVVMGEQCADGRVTGLCNAVILAEPRAPFLRKWYSGYHSFRSAGRDEFWDEHSVKLPYALSRQFPDEITVLRQCAFFWPSYTDVGLALIFECANPIDLSRSYATHLWQARAWEKYLESLTPRGVRTIDSNFHLWARPILADLPDDYGVAGIPVRVAQRIRQLRRTIRESCGF